MTRGNRETPHFFGIVYEKGHGSYTTRGGRGSGKEGSLVRILNEREISKGTVRSAIIKGKVYEGMRDTYRLNQL